MNRALYALLFLAFCLPLTAQSVTATWAPNTEDDLAGYVLYYGTASQNYSHQIETRDTSLRVDSLQIGQTYYFVVKAYDESGNMSAPSEEVNITIQASAVNYDLNHDGIVDPDDAPSIRLHYGRIVDDLNGLHIYDLNNDGIIDPEDVDELRKHYGELR